MNFVIPDFYPAAAELFVVAMSFVVLMTGTFLQNSRSLSYYLTQFTLLGAAVVTVYTMDGQVTLTFTNMYVDDLMGDFLKLMVYLSVAVVLLYSRSYIGDRRIESTEYYMLVIYATLGMMVMIAANHFLTLYLGLELLSLSLYALVATQRDSARATEAAMKYFVLGALASGLLLYGMSMLYGATGSLELSRIAQAIYHQGGDKTVLMFGLVFVVAGLAFKLGVVPFHMWIPDVYQGAPTSVTLLIASAPKLAAFGMAMRLLVNGLFELADQWQSMLMFLAVLSIALGNIAAIAQPNLKRMLGYSGISHMGFMLLGLVSGVVEGDRHFVFGASAGVEDGRFTDGSDGAARLFEIFDVDASDDKTSVVGHRVGEGNVASDFGEVDQRDGVHAIEVIAYRAAIGELHFAMARPQHGDIRSNAAGVRRHAANQHREHVFAARKRRQHVPGFADQVAITVEVRPKELGECSRQLHATTLARVVRVWRIVRAGAQTR